MSHEKEFFGIISELDRRNVLKHFVLIGSWVLKVYQHNYPLENFNLITKDIDLLVKKPRGPFPKDTQNIYNILQEKGYKALHSTTSNMEKYIPDKSIKDNELDIEFLCQPGRHIQEICLVKPLGIKAQPLQYQNILLENSITLHYNGVKIDVPKPEIWAIHKIAVSQLRTGEKKRWKSSNDLNIAHLIVKGLGKDTILKSAEQFKGKFLKLFKKGWNEYTESWR